MSTISGRKKSIISASGVSIDQPVANNTLLNKAASESLYQQCSRLRSRLWTIPQFPEYFRLSSSAGNARLSTDPVTQLWDCLALGVPLCYLYNLLPSPPSVPIAVETDPAQIDVNNDKEKKRAIILFAMQVRVIDPTLDVFKVTDLVNDRSSTDGFVKVVRSVAVLLSRLPKDVFSEAPSSPPPSIAPSASTDSLLTDGAPPAPVSAKEAAKANIIRELVDTERKYVQDMEVMQRYAEALAADIDQDTIHYLFPNLNYILNFQRKFLIRLEGIAENQWRDQHWGAPFVESEEEFIVYEPYCANYLKASETTVELVQLLEKQNHIINARAELPAFLIKPVQRVCKYPLLMESLVKASSRDDYPHYDELVEGVAACKRIADRINEAQRRTENRDALENLKRRVEDWKGHATSNFGELLLDDIFVVTKSDVDREYHVFLFEKIILCCKENVHPPMSAKKVGKSNSILKKQQPTVPVTGAALQNRKRNTPLLLKGRIFLTNVTSAAPQQRSPGQYALQVWWSGEDDLEYFTLRCRNEEQMKMWENQINRLIHDIAGRRGTGASASDRLSGTNRVRNTGEPSPQPRYPPTTYDRQATMSTASQFGRAAGATRPTTPYGSDFSGPGGYPGHGGFELDGEDEFEDYPPALSMPPSGRGTPSGTRSRAGSRTPVGYEDDVSTTTTSSTARYRQNGGPVPPAVNGLPSGPAVRGSLSRPSMSRLSSAASGGSATSAESFGPGASQRPGLRSQFSSTRLKNAFDSSGSPNDSRVSLPPNRISGASSQLSRSRSVSQPTAYVPKPVPPPLPTNGNWEDGTVQSEDGSKRGSGSSQATTESSDNVSSPVTPYGSSDSSLGSYEAPVKVKVHFHEDIFVVHMPVHSEFADLVEKVGKKIRLCGPRRDDGPLRLKYQDEDGDRISLGSTEDWQMASESVGPGAQLILHVA